MKWARIRSSAIATTACVITAMSVVAGGADEEASPIFGARYLPDIATGR